MIDQQQLPEFRNEIKDALGSLGRVCMDYEAIEAGLISRIKSLCQCVINDHMLEFDVALNCDDYILNREMIEVKISINFRDRSSRFTCLWMDEIVHLNDALGGVTPRIHAENGTLCLYYKCYSLVSSLKGNLSLWEDSDDEESERRNEQ